MIITSAIDCSYTDFNVIVTITSHVSVVLTYNWVNVINCIHLYPSYTYTDYSKRTIVNVFKLKQNHFHSNLSTFRWFHTKSCSSFTITFSFLMIYYRCSKTSFTITSHVWVVEKYNWVNVLKWIHLYLSQTCIARSNFWLLMFSSKFLYLLDWMYWLVTVSSLMWRERICAVATGGEGRGAVLPGEEGRGDKTR